MKIGKIVKNGLYYAVGMVGGFICCFDAASFCGRFFCRTE